MEIRRKLFWVQAFVSFGYKPLWVLGTNLCEFWVQAFVSFGYTPLWVLGTSLCEFWVQAFVSFYWLRFCVYLLQTLSVYIDWDSVFIFNTLLRLFQLWFHLFLRDFLCLNWLWVFIIFHSLFVSLLTLLTVFSSQGRQCLFQLSISNRLCVSIQVMILCLAPRDASVFFNCLFLTDYVCLYRLWFCVYLPGTPVSFSIVYF
jgi:hypothetical protein